MIIDNRLVFDPAGTAITATATSTNIIDLGTQQDFGVGDKLGVRVISNNAFAAAGGATLNIQIQGAPNNGGSPGTFVTLAETGALTIAQLNSMTAQDFNLVGFDLPTRMAGTLPRFLQLNYVVATGPFTAGALQAFITLGDADQQVLYPSGITISN